MRTLRPHSSGPLYSNTAIGTLAVDAWWLLQEGLGRVVANFILFDVAL